MTNVGPIAGEILEAPVTHDTRDDGVLKVLPAPVKSKSLSDAKEIDIEHASVPDDPRQWSHGQKTVTLLLVSGAAIVAGLGGNIYNPAINQIRFHLHASSAEISWSVSLFVLIQGGSPLFWSPISEIIGRKPVYLVSMAIATAGCAVAAISRSIGLLIGMRCLQAVGTSTVVTIGASTLADIYEPSQRGTMMGIFYSAPLLGPSLGPMIGGALTAGFNWRATFWFMVIFCGLSLVCFVFLFRDTFRRERSHAYQQAILRIRRESVAPTQPPSPVPPGTIPMLAMHADPTTQSRREGDLEAAIKAPSPTPTSVSLEQVKPTFKDVNPIPPLWHTLQRPNNAVILIASCLIFALCYFIPYTTALTLGAKYHYGPLRIGVILLSFGIGCMGGSISGGRWSDHTLAKLQVPNGRKNPPETRLLSTRPVMLFIPPCLAAFGWVCEKRVHVAAVCVFLFLNGFLLMWIHSSVLAYIVDANTGRSSAAIATNSSFRGLMGFIAAEAAVPLQKSIGDGGAYTLWAGIMVVVEGLILLLIWRGGRWRERAILREAAASL